MTGPAGVAVVVDSTHYLPRELVAAHDLHEVSLYVGWAGELQREAEISDLDAFYARLRTEPEVPRTSQPSVGDFLDVYRPLVEAGRDIVSIHLASGLSGTCASALEASGVLQAEGAAGRVAVVDSQSGGAGLGGRGGRAARG